MKTDNLSCVPKVRFPGFDKPWNYMHGDELFSVSSERNDGSNLPVLALSQNMGAVPRDVIDYNVVVSDSSLNNYKMVRNGDFIISLRSFQGGIEYSSCDGLCSSAYIVLRKRVPMVDSFYKYYFKTSRFIAALNKNLEGIRDGKVVSFKQFSELMIPYPSLDEQQRIASCLTSLDDIIKETERKIESLKNHKKGLMQIELHEMENSIDYVSSCKGQHKRLDECAVLVKENVNVDSLGSDVKYLSTENMISDFGGISEFQSKPVSGSYCLFQVGDILLSNIRPYLKKIWLATSSGICSPDIIVVRPLSIFSEYLAAVIKSDSFVYSVMKYAQGVKMPRGDKEEIMKYSFYCPNSLSEQQKIASCLSSINDVITSYEEKLRLLRLHKKGLMQQFFPPMNINL